MLNDIERITTLPSVDGEYRFGKPKTYLTAHELARLTILRSKLGEKSRRARGGAPHRQARSSDGGLSCRSRALNAPQLGCLTACTFYYSPRAPCANRRARRDRSVARCGEEG